MRTWFTRMWNQNDICTCIRSMDAGLTCFQNMELDRFVVMKTSWCNVWYTHYYYGCFNILYRLMTDSTDGVYQFSSLTSIFSISSHLLVCDMRSKGGGGKNSSKTPFRLEVNGNGIKINWIDRSSCSSKRASFYHVFFCLSFLSIFFISLSTWRD